MRVAALALVALALAACEPSFDDRFRTLAVGDSRDDAVAALGAPDLAHTHFHTPGWMGQVEVLDGVVPESTTVDVLRWTRPVPGDTLEYWIFLTGGEIVATYDNSIHAAY